MRVPAATSEAEVREKGSRFLAVVQPAASETEGKAAITALERRYLVDEALHKATPVIPPPVVSAPDTPPNTPETITETVPPGVTGTVTFSNGTTPIGTAR